MYIEIYVVWFLNILFEVKYYESLGKRRLGYTYVTDIIENKLESYVFNISMKNGASV